MRMTLFIDGGQHFSEASGDRRHSERTPAASLMLLLLFFLSCLTAHAQTNVSRAAAETKIGNGSTTVTITGTSLDVNCTGGCGTPSQAQTYFATTSAIASAASQDAFNLYNASGSGKVIKVLSIRISQDGSAAVTGLQAAFTASRFTTVGATCTSGGIALADTTNAAVPAQVTVNKQCTTDPAGTLTTLGFFSFYADETNPSTQVLYEFFNNGGQPITLREGQGLMLRLGATAPVGVYSITAEISM